MLDSIKTSGRKMGVEINSYAREEAIKKGIVCFEDIAQVSDNDVDLLISNHALEHVESPFHCISEFRRVVRNGGRMVLVVPHETSRRVDSKDKNMHLYTWTPQNMYNLCKACGWEIESCESLCNAWMPYYTRIQYIFGWKNFYRLCNLYGKFRNLYQTKVVCVKRQ